MDRARERHRLALRINSRPRGIRGFGVLSRGWKGEPTIGWCMNARRDVRDHERRLQRSEAHRNRALITMTTRLPPRKEAARGWMGWLPPTF